MIREIALIALILSPKIKLTVRSVIRYRLRHQRELYVRTDRTVQAKNVIFVRRLARRAMVQHRVTVLYVVPDYPSSKANVSLWALMGCV